MKEKNTAAANNNEDSKVMMMVPCRSLFAGPSQTQTNELEMAWAISYCDDAGTMCLATHHAHWSPYRNEEESRDRNLN